MVLHAIQEKFGWISSEAVQWTAKKLELQPINVFEILTFYPMLRQQRWANIRSRSAAR